jgi:hypothetical protein
MIRYRFDESSVAGGEADVEQLTAAVAQDVEGDPATGHDGDARPGADGCELSYEVSCHGGRR